MHKWSLPVKKIAYGINGADLCADVVRETGAVRFTIKAGPFGGLSCDVDPLVALRMAEQLADVARLGASLAGKGVSVAIPPTCGDCAHYAPPTNRKSPLGACRKSHMDPVLATREACNRWERDE